MRPVAQGDEAAIAALLTQLGYPAEAAAVKPRLSRLAQERLTLAVVGEHAGAVAGLATCHIAASIHTDYPIAYLSAIVVDEAHRGHGIGRALCAHIEDWARSHGAVRLSLVTNLQRADAHAFYERIGYVKTAYRYAKGLV